MRTFIPYGFLSDASLSGYLNYTPSGRVAFAMAGVDTVALFYIHADVLGSFDVITDATGAVVERNSFDPWGRRRNPADWSYVNVPTTPLLTGRGFTGHEHLEGFGLINANGRIYDPVLGMFLSPDPYIQAPETVQNFNRYSYCLNNPLKYTDPDGEYFFSILSSLFCPSLTPVAMMLDNACMQGGATPVKNGAIYLNGAKQGNDLLMLVDIGLSYLNVPGIIPNGLLKSASNVLRNGLSNSLNGNDFFDNWGNSATIGFISGAYSGYNLSKESGHNYWWGNEVKYGRNQWSFFNIEKPYHSINFDISNVGSFHLFDCVPTTFTELNDSFGGNNSYNDYVEKTNYIIDEGVSIYIRDYEGLVTDNFDATLFNHFNLQDENYMQSVKNSGTIISVHMKYAGMYHSDNIRSIKYFSTKTVVKIRIGNFRLKNLIKNYFRTWSVYGVKNN